MKRISLGILCSIALLAAGCEKLSSNGGEDGRGPLSRFITFEDGSKSLSFDFLEYERSFILSLDGPHNNVSVITPDWIELAGKVDEKSPDIKLFVQANETDQKRTGVVTITAGENEIHIRISQIGALMDCSMRTALTDFYYALDGDNWRFNEGWLSDSSYAKWYGISSPAVSNDTINGNIRPNVYKGTDDGRWEMRSFEGSKWFSGGPNGLKGTVPESFSRIVDKFTCIEFWNEPDLEGELTNEEWNTNLYCLYVPNGLRTHIRNLMECKKLQLFNSYRTEGEIDERLADMTDLEEFFICEENDGDISGYIPKRIGNLKKLKRFRVWGSISGTIPESLYELSELQTFEVDGGHLTGEISPKVGNMKALREFVVKENRLTGRIPEEFGTLKNLYFLGLEYNNFDPILPEFYRYYPCNDGRFWMDQVGGFELGESVLWHVIKDDGEYYTMPTPKWFVERYHGSDGWLGNALYCSVETDCKYPYATDLQYPATEYYWDGNDWRHPKYEHPARFYHIVDGEWSYDPNWNWCDEVYPSMKYSDCPPNRRAE